MSENDFECFASTGVITSETMRQYLLLTSRTSHPTGTLGGHRAVLIPFCKAHRLIVRQGTHSCCRGVGSHWRRLSRFQPSNHVLFAPTVSRLIRAAVRSYSNLRNY